MKTCNHCYAANYRHQPRGMGERCPYPEIYQRIPSKFKGAPDHENHLTLPQDSRGLCIFHSQDVEWKRENGFERRFLHLLEMLDEADQERTFYDFAEFVFIGGDVESGVDSAQGALRIRDRTFTKAAYFTRASFLAQVDLKNLNFADSAFFGEADFHRDLQVRNTKFRGFDLTQANVRQCASFSDVEFLSFALLNQASFTGESDGRVVTFENVRFRSITDFSHAVFSHAGNSTVAFRRVDFEDVLDFTSAVFRCHVSFDEVSFASIAEFIDTSFEMVTSAARYRGAAVEFNQLELKPGAVLTFKSNEAREKMFDHDVQMSFRSEPAGIVRFENVNFSKLTPDTRDRLLQLTKSGKVEIGPGCIKYRLQTDVRSIPVNHGNTPLVLELCQTFANYFTASNGISLGFEIVKRTAHDIMFFYFTDEDLTKQAFFDRLRRTEEGLWNLLSVQSTGQLLALQPAPDMAPAAGEENGFINAIDGISALIGTFFRVGARIALGSWQEKDTKVLLGAIRFSEDGAERRARSLHRLIEESYTGRALFGINSQQNQPLLPPVPQAQKYFSREKIRILFLGANSLDSPLALDEEFSKIKLNIRLAEERDNIELKQEWAVTVDSLIQAMVDESPAIVHFSGHGDRSGIVLQDAQGRPKPVAAQALAGLFAAFSEKIRCVILNSCYSKQQAKAIRLHVPHVIAVASKIPDSASVAFSTGFYKAIGAGRDVPFAFRLGLAAIRLEGVSAKDLPVLL